MLEENSEAIKSVRKGRFVLLACISDKSESAPGGSIANRRGDTARGGGPAPWLPMLETSSSGADDSIIDVDSLLETCQESSPLVRSSGMRQLSELRTPASKYRY